MPRDQLTHPLPKDDAVTLLLQGSLELEGLLVEASNATLRAFVSLDGVEARCVYKPVRGERPLWDFPDGTLAGREVAAYLVSEETGWDIVPPTVLRDGPLGVGACQLWIDAASAAGVPSGSGEAGQPSALLGFVPEDGMSDDWRAVAEARGPNEEPYLLAHAADTRLARMAAFDAAINNADRKGGHLLVTDDGHLYGVDHGVCFHTDPKLRTVVWGFAGEPLPEDVAETLGRLRSAVDGKLGGTLADHLTSGEITALGDRITALLGNGVFPEPDHDWPPIPWPPL